MLSDNFAENYEDSDAMATPSNEMRLRRPPPKGPRPKGPPPLAEAKSLPSIHSSPMMMQPRRNLGDLAPPKKLGPLKPLGSVDGLGTVDNGAGREESEVVFEGTETISGMEVVLTITQIPSCIFMKAVDSSKGEEFHVSANIEQSYVDSHCCGPEEKIALYRRVVERCCFKSGGARNKQKKGEKMRRELHIKRGALFVTEPRFNVDLLGEPFLEERRALGKTSACVRAYLDERYHRLLVRLSDPVERDIEDAWIDIPAACISYFAERRRRETLNVPESDSQQLQNFDAVDHICSMLTLQEKELNLRQVMFAKQSPTLKLETEEALRLYSILQATKIQCSVRIMQARTELVRRQVARELRKQESALRIQCLLRTVSAKEKVKRRRARLLKLKQDSAATKIQASFRRKLAELRVQLLRHRWKSATTIQAQGRSLIVRQRQVRAEREVSSLRIQCCIRCWQAFLQIKKRQERVRLGYAATRIQNVQRQRSALSRVVEMRRRSCATISIQRYFRGWAGRLKARKKQNEKKARKEAETQARLEAEMKAKKEAEENAKREAEERARKEAEEQARKEAEEKAAREERVRIYAEEKAKKDAERRRKREAEDQARRDAEEMRKKAAEEARKKKEAEEAEVARIKIEEERKRADALAEAEKARLKQEAIAAEAAARAAAEEEAQLKLAEAAAEEATRTPTSPKNSFSGERPPEPLFEPPEEPTEDPKMNWHEVYDEEGNVYYYNDITEESSWNCPWTDEINNDNFLHDSQVDIDAEVERRVQERLAQIEQEKRYNDEFQGKVEEQAVETDEIIECEIPSEDVQRAFQYARHGRVNEIETELTEGLDVHVRDESRKTLLHVAAANNHRKIVKLLHSFGADLDCQDIDGNTPLHLACQYNYEKIIKLLTKCKSNTNIPNKWGYLAFDWQEHCNENKNDNDQGE